ncbi:MAG: peptide chain release factor N(5)-glutamine methyltransferase [Rhodanobacteraceae bacterium]
MNVGGLVVDAAARIGTENGRLEAEALLAHVLGKPRTWLYAWPEHELEAQQLARFESMVESRVRGEPIAYLTGHREFWSLDLLVTRDVLIPRHETELLVELALARIPREIAHVADLGTGSGAIALAIARERAQARMLATDASSAALAVARANAERLMISNIEFAQGDWCDALGEKEFDVIVSNPPYIASGDAHLDLGDLRSEPLSALVSGSDGLDAIRRLVGEAPARLRPGGWLLLEHGWDQAARVRALLEEGGFIAVASASDDGGHERVTMGRLLR